MRERCEGGGGAQQQVAAHAWSDVLVRTDDLEAKTLTRQQLLWYAYAQKRVLSVGAGELASVLHIARYRATELTHPLSRTIVAIPLPAIGMKTRK